MFTRTTHRTGYVHADNEPCTGTCTDCSHKNSTEPVDAAKPAAPRPIKKILVAVEHEHHPALQTALMLATPLHAQIAVVLVVESANLATADNAYAYTALVEDLRVQGKETLKHIESEIPEQARAFTILREGQAAQEILTAAADWNADLIILGTHRRGTLARFFLGSSSQSVIRKSQCPVLLVNDPAAPTVQQP